MMRRIWVLTLLTAVLVSAVSLVAIPSSARAESAFGEEKFKAGDKAPDFTAVDLDGNAGGLGHELPAGILDLTVERLDAATILLCEVDGTPGEVEDEIERVRAVLEQSGYIQMQVAVDDAQRQLFWSGRKAAFPAVGRISPDYYCIDGTIPRKTLGDVLNRMEDLSDEYGLRVVNVFHAGDGNLHPLILFDANKPGDLETCEAMGTEILKLCVEVGGCLTGEHGVGVEKRDLMLVQYNEGDLEAQVRVKDVFDAKWLLNPAKVFPLITTRTRREAA